MTEELLGSLFLFLIEKDFMFHKVLHSTFSITPFTIPLRKANQWCRFAKH